jgi:hypothetical protein
MTLELHLPLHDGANGTAVDYSGNDNHGTLNGGPTTGVAGRGGLQATSFDGTDDYIATPVRFNDYSDAITVSAWVRLPTVSSSGYERVMAARSSGGNTYAFLRLWDGNPNFGSASSTSNQAVGSSVVPENEWVHLVGVWDGSEYRVYLNGSLDGSTSGNWESVDADAYIAARNDQNDGTVTQYNELSVCDVRVYNRALSAAEIQTLYEWGSADLARPPEPDVAAPTVSNFSVTE